MKTIIFDFDGVIHDTFEFHRGKIYEYSGIKLSKQIFKDMHNGNFYESTPKEAKEIDWEEYKDFINKDFVELIINKEIAQFLKYLKQKSKNLIIISSGGRENILKYFENNGLFGIFETILGKEDGHSKINKFNFIFNTYNINNTDCLFITDTLGDILEANKLSIKTIAINTGFHPTETLQKGNPYKIISNLSEIGMYL